MATFVFIAVRTSNPTSIIVIIDEIITWSRVTENLVKEFLVYLQKHKFRYWSRKIPPVKLSRRQLNAIRIFAAYFIKIRFNIVIPFISVKWFISFVLCCYFLFHIPHFFQEEHRTRPSHSPLTSSSAQHLVKLELWICSCRIALHSAPATTPLRLPLDNK
jgi:hypothetical protein